MDMSPPPSLLSEASRNLLCDCAGLSPGDEVVICGEAPEHGWYDAEAAETVAAEAPEDRLAGPPVRGPAPRA